MKRSETPAPVASLTDPSLPCPECGSTGTLSASAELGAPLPGDLVCCLCCGTIGVVTVPRQVRVLTLGDLAEYSLEDIGAIARAVNAYRRATTEPQ